MNWFISLFTTYKMLVSLHMKSGEVIKVHCDSINIQTSGNDLVSYDIKNVKLGDAYYFRLDDISAITYVKL